MPRLNETDVIERIDIGRKFMEPFAVIDLNQSRKFLNPDADTLTSLDEDIIPAEFGTVDHVSEVSEGTINQIAANILTQIAAIGIGEPEIRVKMDRNAPPEYAILAQDYWNHIWRTKRLRRISAHMLTKKGMCGLGIAFYRWDEKRAFVVEPCHSWDYFVDPFVTDWKSPDYAGRRVRMSRRKAIDLYGKRAIGDLLNTDDVPGLDREPVDIRLYWDADHELHVYEGKVLNEIDNPNLYLDVPQLVLLGDYNPSRNPFPIGNVQFGAGMQAALTELSHVMYYTALNGGAMTVLDETYIKGSVEEAWQNARRGGILSVKGKASDVMQRVDSETISPAMTPAIQMCMNGMDSIMGVGQYDRGVVTSSPQHATEAMLAANRSGARAFQNRLDYEDFIREMAEALITCTARFGGPDARTRRPSEIDTLWEACTLVTDVRVVPGSTAFKDPGAEMQPRIMLVQTLLQAAPLLAQLGQPIPNLKTHIDKIMNSMGDQDTAPFWSIPQQPEEEDMNV